MVSWTTLLGVAIELNVDAGLEDEALIPLLTAKDRILQKINPADRVNS